MLLKPYITQKREGVFRFGSYVKATVAYSLDKDIIKELWNGFCFLSSKLETTATEELVLLIGDAQLPELEDYAYVINVNQTGIALVARDEQSLLHGYITLLEYVEVIELKQGTESFCIPCGAIKDKPAISSRMVHFCVFPETTAEFIEKFIKLCGGLKYNYFIIEFWGMLRFDCLKELGWEFAFTKDQIRKFVALAKDLGMEVIPFFNHWGHATGCRDQFGKHVVLDQNPRLQGLFDHTGYIWNIEKREVRNLMKKVRRELIELCGEGAYFHIGCDEAGYYQGDQALKMADLLLDYLNEVTEDLLVCGRRPMMWGDMLLHKSKVDQSKESYFCNCPEEAMSRRLLENLDRRIIIADWQYSANEYPVLTSLIFKNLGFDVITCSYDYSNQNIYACAETVKRHNLLGFMHTTWHTLHYGVPNVAFASASGWQEEYLPNEEHRWATLEEPAALLRKHDFVNGNYERAGWAPRQTGMGLK